MAFMLEYLEKPGIVCGHTTGTMTQQELVKLAEEAFLLGGRHGTHRYLVDHLDMTPAVDIDDLLDLPKIHEQMGLRGEVKVAAVFSSLSVKKDDFDLYQMRAWSQGIHNIRHFSDLRQAMNWLMA